MLWHPRRKGWDGIEGLRVKERRAEPDSVFDVATGTIKSLRGDGQNSNGDDGHLSLAYPYHSFSIRDRCENGFLPRSLLNHYLPEGGTPCGESLPDREICDLPRRDRGRLEVAMKAQNLRVEPVFRGEIKEEGGFSLLASIGNTPLIQIRQVTKHLRGVQIFAKAEWLNPGGSVKDRAGQKIIEDGERSGHLTKDKIILDSTSGNTGIAYAMISAIRGYRVKLVVPANISEERKKALEAYGVKLIFTDPILGSDGALLEAKRIYESNPYLYFKADQYNNPSNWKAHYETTGVEILHQTRGRVTHFVAGVGTGGTLIGTGKRLKEYNPHIQLFGVQPDSGFHGIEGLKHIETAIRPGIYDETILDGTFFVKTEDAFEMASRLTREEGLWIGPSSGAAFRASLKLAESIDRGMIVTIFPDGGARYPEYCLDCERQKRRLSVEHVAKTFTPLKV